MRLGHQRRAPGSSAAIDTTLPGASCNGGRTSYAANLTAAIPKSAWGLGEALLRDQPPTDVVHAQFNRILDGRQAAGCSSASGCPGRHLGVTASPKQTWRQIWSNNPQELLNGTSADAPMWSASSPTAPSWSCWSEPSWPTSTMNGTEQCRNPGLDILAQSRLTKILDPLVQVGLDPNSRRSISICSRDGWASTVTRR